MDSAEQAIAIVGLGAILPDAPNAPAFWQNIIHKRYSITETPPERWSIADYYNPDPKAPDKTYSKIGGWVRGFTFDWKRFRIPPKVAAAMDEGQQWALTVAADALADYGYPQRPLPTERMAVILGTAMGGELHYTTNLRIVFPEYANALAQVPEFASLPASTRQAILGGYHRAIDAALPPISEDSMPGELPNIVSGRVANVLDLRGPNFITDAACASSLAALEAAMQLLTEHKVDAALTGGVDRNMGVSSFVKFCKIGALSATGTRPFGDGADGFVMGEGAAVFLLKRLADAERDGDPIYAVIRGVGGASDGKGKGITAPNPIGQQLAMQRAWAHAGLDPATATLVEAHGTSTRVGDVVEVESLTAVFGGAPRHSIGLGSAKSNIGHLKAGAGAAGLLKAVYAVYHKTLPPTLNATIPNPGIDFANSPFRLIHDAAPWEKPAHVPRRCGVSAYGFGGTNFHVVLEEHIPGALTTPRKTFQAAGVPTNGGQSVTTTARQPASAQALITNPPLSIPTPQWPAPLRGILALGAATPADLQAQVEEALAQVQEGWTPPLAVPETAVLQSRERLIIDFGDREELLGRLQKALRLCQGSDARAWKAMEAQGIFRGSGGAPGKIAFLFPGQGSQYVNMGRELLPLSPVVAEVFAEADRVMTPILGRPLTDYIFVDATDDKAVMQAELALMQTAVTQPAMLTLDIAMLRLLESYGFRPDMVMGHSLGEYAALIAAGVMPFADALEAAAARGEEMTKVDVGDNGRMAAILAPFAVVEQTLAEIDGYVVPANINSHSQSVIGGASKAVEAAIKRFGEKGYKAIPIPVSHAFHTQIVAPASKPLRQVLDRLRIYPPKLPLVANVTGDFYPTTVEGIKEILEKQIASPVQWVKGLETLYNAGARAFVEVGPKRALQGFARDVFADKPDVLPVLTNHPKTGALPAFNMALCALYAAGYTPVMGREPGDWKLEQAGARAVPEKKTEEESMIKTTVSPTNSTPEAATLEIMAQLIAQAVQQVTHAARPTPQPAIYDHHAPPAGSVVISGTGLGLPGAEKSVMDPDNALRILRGEQFVDLIPERFRKRILAKQITRLVKDADGNGRFETITDPDEVIKLAGRPGYFNLAEEYGVPEKLIEALDSTTQLAMAAGFDALREAGIPLVQTYRRTTTDKFLPDRWLLPESLRDETGVIFASAFPGGDRFAEEMSRYYTFQNRLEQLQMLHDVRAYTRDAETLRELDRRINDLREALQREPYTFDRRFLFRILSMGHSQFAEYIGARGPNTQVNAACASTAQAIAIAEDWIRNGRCRRVIVIAADNVTGDNLMEWVGAGFLSVGAAATDDRVDEAALPFDRRRHGTLMGMGAAALVLESEDAVRERGMRGIVELLASETNNSAYHGTRLDVSHIAQVMNALVTSAERRFGLNRQAMAPQTVFMSHETYTPARGGSAAAEGEALRHTFGEAAREVIVANTKGFTGHPMGVGIEDVIAVKILEYGIVPPVPNFREVDPDLGPLNLSRGGRYPVQYALHLAAGFGSQIAMTLTRRIPGALNRVDHPAQYQHWLDAISGYDFAQTVVDKRILRIQANGVPQRHPASSRWQPGTGPTLRALVSHASTTAVPPARMIIPEPITAVAPPKPAVPPAPAKAPTPTPTPAPEPVQVTLPPAIEQKSVGAGEQGSGEAAERRSESDTVAAAHPVTQPPSQPVTPSGQDPVTAKVLAIVSAQTGYPTDMLDMDLDLEADLGIDTVKQAETFAAIRAEFNIPRRDDLSLRDYTTLEKVVGFVREMRPDLREAESTKAESGGAESMGTEERKSGGEMLAAAHPVTQSPSHPATPSTHDPVTAKVLAIVSEQTGYPTDMLDMDLDLEADLGIDTVKQAETFAAIRQAFDIPRRDDLSLRDYTTLEKVIAFVYEMRPDLKVDAGMGEVAVAKPAVSHIPASSLAEANRLPRRVPVVTLRPPLAWCKPTGVTLNEKSHVIVALDQGGVGKALIGRLQKRGVTVLALDVSAPTAELAAQVAAWYNAGPIQGVYWLAALDAEPDLSELDLPTWRELNRQRIKNYYAVMRVLYDAMNQPAAFLVAATRLGGEHGYGATGATAPLGGAVGGFTKAFKRERPNVLAKVVDFALDRKTAVYADMLIAETEADPGAVEVGYAQGQRVAVTLAEQPVAETNAPALALDAHSVLVVTGAAGGITSAIVADLAAASGGIFYLLDLAAAPTRDDAKVRLFRSDKEALKQMLIAEAKAAGERPTPALIEKQIMAVERAEAALRAIEAVEAAGGTVHYHQVNLLDGEAITAVVADIRARYGKIDALIHAGGLEISHPLDKKEPQEFDLVYDVKADGLFSLLRATHDLPIGAVMVFSSVAGRFGNNGQTDYSAANDLLCKLMSSLRRWRPETRGIALDWTAWGEIGMATRGSIPKIMEMAGIEMLPPAVGIPTVRRELLYGGGEVVVGGALGILTQEWDETGGLDAAKVNEWLARQQRPLLMIGEVTAYRLYGRLEAQTALDPRQQPFLYDHAMEGTPLLPGVMGTETFAELAHLLAPDYHVTAVVQETFHAPFKFYRMEPQTLYLTATAVPDGADILVSTQLLSRRALKSGVQEKLHFTATVRLSASAPEAPTTQPPTFSGEVIGRDAIYARYFHGPAYQVLEKVALAGNTAVGLLAANLPPNNHPAHAQLLMAPRLIELAFQTAGMWEMQRKGVMALPLAIDAVTAYRQEEEADGQRLYAVVTAVDDGAAFDAQVVDENGRLFVAMRGYRTVALVG